MRPGRVLLLFVGAVTVIGVVASFTFRDVTPDPAGLAAATSTTVPLPIEPEEELVQLVNDGPTVSAAPETTAATTTTTTEPPVVLPVPDPAPTVAYFDEELVDLGTITIPALGIDRTLHQGISLYNIDRGPSHWPGTAEPGELGNVVIAGHRTTHGAPFRGIDQLVEGDEVIFAVDGETFVYRVVGDEVVLPSGLHIVEQTNAHTATLFACHPPGSAEYRYVVHLELDPDAVIDEEPTAA
ncbi:MAG: class E sortase [Actinomycetota bacterium]